MQTIRCKAILGNLADARRHPHAVRDARGNQITPEQVRQAFHDLEDAMYKVREAGYLRHSTQRTLRLAMTRAGRS